MGLNAGGAETLRRWFVFGDELAGKIAGSKKRLDDMAHGPELTRTLRK